MREKTGYPKNMQEACACEFSEFSKNVMVFGMILQFLHFKSKCQGVRNNIVISSFQMQMSGCSKKKKKTVRMIIISVGKKKENSKLIFLVIS